MITVGLLRFGLDLPEQRVATVLEDGWGLPIAQSTVSRLSTEFLVRWRMLSEERLPPWVASLGPWVVQIDGTVVVGSPVTFRAREARTGATLWAEQLEAESKPEVVRFLRALRGRFGAPALLLRDLSATLREAAAEVYPEVPQGEDHWHFLSTIGPVILVDHEPLRKGLLAGDALALLAQWSRRLPTEGRTLDDLERVWVRLALEWIDAARLHAGGFPWRLPYLEVARRLRRVEGWSEALVRAGAARNVGVPEVAELRGKVRTVLARESVSLPLGRLSAASECWEELRRAMRVERGRRSREDLAPLAVPDVARVRREIDEVGRRFSARGEWAEAIWGEVVKRFEEHAPYLWPVVPGRNEVVRSTVALERAHRDDRHRIRRRTGQSDTGEAMGEMGSLLAFWSNARCERFVREGLAGVNLWEAFAQQDPREVRRRMAALPREGRRPRVTVARGKAEGRLAAFVELLNGSGPLEPRLSAWGASVGSEGLQPL